MVSIRWVIPIATILLTTLVAGGVGVVGERNARRALTEELVARLCARANNLALVGSSALLTPFPELTLHPLLLTMREREPALALATICDRSGAILGDADASRLGQRFTPPSGLRLRRAGQRLPDVEVYESRTLLLASSPIVHPNGARLGRVFIALGRGTIDEAVGRARQPVLVLYVAFLAFGIVGSFLLTATLLRPLGALRAGLERIGSGDLDARVEIRSRTEFGHLAETVNHMAEGLKKGQAQAMERERLSHEIELAQRIQRHLLPPERVVAGGFAVVGTQRPAAEVGGDFYDAFRLPDGRIGFAVADVAGKGLGGCLVTSMVAALLAALRDGSSGPAHLLEMLDRSLSKRLERGVFVTMFIGFVDPRKGTLTYASAGHHPALLVHRDGRTQWLKAEGLPIGTDRRQGIGHTLKEETAVLAPGDFVVQTTDGIHETEGGPAGEQFGFDRTAATLAAAAPGGAQAMIDQLSGAVRSWRVAEMPADDETIVVLCWERVASDDPLDNPLDRVAEARERGKALKLPPTLDALVRLEDWVGRLPGFSGPAAAGSRIHLALYELCANIVEHGRPVNGEPIALWWVPDAEDASDPKGGAAAGYVVILDQGAPFSADNSGVVDLGRADVRRKGRGLGIDLVRRATSRLVYHPGTPLGNVTLVAMRVAQPEHLQEEAA